MASVFGHVMASSAIGYAFFPRQVRPATLFLTGFCAFAPDLDVLAFRFGIPYASQWGHRGWTHSVVFSVFFGIFMGLLAAWATQKFKDSYKPLVLWCVLSTLSHALLDMCTNGGMGCAIWWPFSYARHFFPFNPILVSPLAVSDFFTEWGMEVLVSECIWIGLPALLLVAFAKQLAR